MSFWHDDGHASNPRRSAMTRGERRQRNRAALKLLVGVFVVAGIVQSMTGPKRLTEAPLDPQTARERAELAKQPVSVDRMCDEVAKLRTYGRAKEEFENCMYLRDNLLRAARGQ